MEGYLSRTLSLASLLGDEVREHSPWSQITSAALSRLPDACKQTYEMTDSEKSSHGNNTPCSSCEASPRSPREPPDPLPLFSSIPPHRQITPIRPPEMSSSRNKGKTPAAPEVIDSQPGPSQDTVDSTPTDLDAQERAIRLRKLQQDEEELELRQLELNQRRAALETSTLLPRSAADDEDDPRKYPAAIQECGKMFFGAIPLRYIHHIYESRFDARSLIYLRRNDYDVAPESHRITLENGSITSTARRSSSKDYKSWSVFVETFTNYRIIFNSFFGEKHNDISVAMDIWFSHLVQWEIKHRFDCVINFALQRLSLILAEPFKRQEWIDFSMKAEYLDETTTKKTASLAGQTSSKRTRSGTCNNFNYRSCASARCEFPHECAGCGGSHPVNKCPSKKAAKSS